MSAPLRAVLRSPNVVCVTGLCSIAALTIDSLVRDGTLLGMDTATAFYPWYVFLGYSVRSGHIPVWNPYQFAGTPFAADPESGWAYLPAMLFFGIVPLAIDQPHAFEPGLEGAGLGDGQRMSVKITTGSVG